MQTGPDQTNRCGLAAFIFFLFSLAGCYATTTKPDLDAQVERLQGNNFPGKLIFERSDEDYDYYRIEDLGVRGRYRVPRHS